MSTPKVVNRGALVARERYREVRKGTEMERYCIIQGDTIAILIPDLRELGNPSGLDFFFNDEIKLVGVVEGDAETANVDVPVNLRKLISTLSNRVDGKAADKIVNSRGVQIRIPKLLEYEKALGLDSEKMYIVPTQEGERGEEKVNLYFLPDAVSAETLFRA